MSEIRAATISNAAGTGPIVLTGQQAATSGIEYTNLGTLTVRGSFNIASVTDTGVGNGTIVLTNAYLALDYICATAGFRSGIGFSFTGGYLLTTTDLGLTTGSSAGSFSDVSHASQIVHGELA